MNTYDGKWIIDQDSPLLDQIAVEMPQNYFRHYMTLRDLINEFVEKGDLESKVLIAKSSIERLLNRLDKITGDK